MRVTLCLIACLVSAGTFADCQSQLSIGNYETAIKHAEKTLTNNKASYTKYLCLGLAHQHLGRFQGAAQAFEKAISLAKTEHEKNDLYFDLSVAFKYLGQFDKSLAYIDKKLTFDRRTQNSSEMGISLATKAAILGDMGRNQEAITLAGEAIQYLERDTDRASTYNNIATGYSSLGDFKNAFKYIDLAIAIDRRQSTAGQKELAIHLMNKAYLYRQQEKYVEALATVNNSLRIIEKGGNRYWLMSGLIHRAKIYELSKDLDRALVDFQAAAKLANEIRAQELEYLLTKVAQLKAQGKAPSKENRKLITQLTR
ncbi:tetratricopeptide repeat protein [Pseudoteredinibacter isoporae]|uniref:Tetratricopeptide (TPR) repeat protein n=1 Tax=Pseudoteredinibacter isoporae TaxID=570281 RepID=A0A7X0JR13_9GAMM|nr:tetratricopeptide repeat protein [Pseudoteredinibacter isoporae]MBB6520073.1 tetratricopeptide (TPR) repeat protein [Pseudoteredinibacter isoporae]NHO85645.1 tetratricopeptide repeat protein [Pseudoteredinibacter isoporae]NIB25903.1 tetratricopeptide repeat protein [Pseudoteredinibacter isoporae]